MSYQIPADLEQRIQAQIATGQFASEEEVLREAISTLERQSSLKRLRALVQEAEDDLAAGRVGPFDAEATKSALDQLLAERSGHR